MIRLNSDKHIEKLRVLFIGNSFSTDSAEYLFSICQSVGIDIVVGVSFDSGMGLKQTWNKLKSNQSITAYQKWSSKNGREEKRGYLLKNIIPDEKWDIVIFQQVSSSSNKPESFHPYLLNLKEYVENNVNNRFMKFGLNMTWAFSIKSPKIANMGYENQIALFDSIQDTYRQVMTKMNFDILIPTGTAIQNARTNSYLKGVGDDLTRDGSHLDRGMGRYIAALTVFEALVSDFYKKATLKKVAFYPALEEVDTNIISLSKNAAKNAVLNPFKITDI